jgi:hypothetical protein
MICSALLHYDVDELTLFLFSQTSQKDNDKEEVPADNSSGSELGPDEGILLIFSLEFTYWHKIGSNSALTNSLFALPDICCIGHEKLHPWDEVIKCIPCGCANACIPHAVEWISNHRTCYQCRDRFLETEVVLMMLRRQI